MILFLHHLNSKAPLYDTNRDGRIDAFDDVFKNLKLWQDRNGDGRTDEGDFDDSDLLRYFLNTRHAKNHPKDIKRRQKNILSLTPYEREN